MKLGGAKQSLQKGYLPLFQEIASLLPIAYPQARNDNWFLGFGFLFMICDFTSNMYQN